MFAWKRGFSFIKSGNTIEWPVVLSNTGLVCKNDLNKKKGIIWHVKVSYIFKISWRYFELNV